MLVCLSTDRVGKPIVASWSRNQPSRSGVNFSRTQGRAFIMTTLVNCRIISFWVDKSVRRHVSEYARSARRAG